MKGQVYCIMKPYERLLRYAVIHTASDETSKTVPTTQRQFNLARVLVDELKAMGVTNARVDDMCYVYASIPATNGYEEKPAIGFIAHMDTVPDFCGENVKPNVIPNYNGEDVLLGAGERVLRVCDFPHLARLAGRTLITTDGTTVLGADDKAGVSEIMTAVERIIGGNIPHGKLCIGFTPDEEVGSGADHFDVKAFGADFAYTVDGGEENEIVFENFNAASAGVDINGFNVHPGSAKDTMINALIVACELNAMLPSGETPRNTEDYEGFFHLCAMNGNVERASMYYILRDHSAAIMTARKATMRHIEKQLNEKYGEGTVKITITDQYQNMESCIKPCFHLVENACDVIRGLGMTPSNAPIRGGTDGARLSFMGLPCPNLGTGGYAYHGPYEHITAEGMELATQVIIGIIGKYAE